MLHEKNNFTRRRFSDRSGGHEVSDDEDDDDDDDDGVDGLGTKKGALPLFSFFVFLPAVMGFDFFTNETDSK